MTRYVKDTLPKVEHTFTHFQTFGSLNLQDALKFKPVLNLKDPLNIESFKDFVNPKDVLNREAFLNVKNVLGLQDP